MNKTQRDTVEECRRREEYILRRRIDDMLDPTCPWPSEIVAQSLATNQFWLEELLTAPAATLAENEFYAYAIEADDPDESGMYAVPWIRPWLVPPLQPVDVEESES